MTLNNSITLFLYVFYIIGLGLALYLFERKLKRLMPELLNYKHILPILLFIAAGSWITVTIILIKRHQENGRL